MGDAASWVGMLRASWVMARAFTRNRVIAVLAFPTAVLSLVPYQVRRVVFLSPDRNGMVIVARYRPTIDMLLAFPVALLIVFTTTFIFSLTFTVAPQLAGVLVLVFLAFGLSAGSLIGPSSFWRAVGPETPPGERWVIIGLAQMPGTRLSALALTRSALRRVPAGAVLVAVAGSEELAAGYARLGFTRGRGPRVYRINSRG